MLNSQIIVTWKPGIIQVSQLLLDALEKLGLLTNTISTKLQKNLLTRTQGFYWQEPLL